MPVRNRFEKDYYATLGVPQEASADEVRKAYRRLALQWHPDRNSGNPQATERFKEISEAYAILIDPAKRQEYDEVRRVGSGPSFGYNRDDLFRDLFTNPNSSAVFDELVREFERMGMRVDRHYFQRVLFGGAIVSGGIFIITPLTPFLGMFKLAKAALRAAAGAKPVEAAASPGLFSGLARIGRALFGLHPTSLPSAQERDSVLTLSLTRAEAENGTSKRVLVSVNGKPRELMVNVPGGVQTGTRLRLRTPQQDLFLSVEVAE
jgi:curved DNA-binding protein CbpA